MEQYVILVRIVISLCRLCIYTVYVYIYVNINMLCSFFIPSNLKKNASFLFFQKDSIVELQYVFKNNPKYNFITVGHVFF